jgi:hypothetical protein
MFSLETMRKARIGLRDGDLGTLREVYFDDEQWVVRYFIVSTSRRSGRDVLIAPEAVLKVNPEQGRLELGLTRQQVESSPPVDFAKPVTRQKAEEYIAYYGWPYFRSAPAGRGQSLVSAVQEDEHWNPHLRSFVEVTGYRIRGTDAHLGRLEDFLVDDRDWTVRYLVTEPRSWWPGKKVLLLPRLVERFDWQHREVKVALTRERIRDVPPWNAGAPLSREDERRVHMHYGVPPYWNDSGAAHLGSPSA